MMAAPNRSDDPELYQTRASTYAWFTGLMKWGTIAVVVILALLAVFLV